MIEMRASHEELRPRITIIGVGGAGNNAVARMVQNDVRGVDFIAVNTDAQALKSSPAERIVQIGRSATEGLGAGACPDRGRIAAEESVGEIETLLDGTHMCFIAAGMGGGTGTGAAPVIAKAARAKGILTVGVVTKPFAFEGKRRAHQAEAGLEELRKHVDTLIVIPNQNLFRVASPNTTFKEAFDLADDILHQGVRGITDLMVNPGFVNLDFADIRTIMKDMGRALMGTGEATGDNRAILAAEAAISNPLLDEAVKGARGLVISISGGEDMRLMEVDEAAGHIKDLVDPDADIIWGSSFNAELTGRIRVSIVATGIEGEAPRMAKVESLRQVAPAVQPLRPMVAASMAPLAAAAMKPAPVVQPARIAVPVQPVQAQPRATVAAPVTAATAPASLPVEAELLLNVACPIVLTPPSAEAIAAAAAAEAQAMDALRGPSLFERMANAARGAVTRAGTGEGKAMPHIYRGRDLPTPAVLAHA